MKKRNCSAGRVWNGNMVIYIRTYLIGFLVLSVLSESLTTSGEIVINKCEDYKGTPELIWQVPKDHRTKDYKDSRFNLSLSEPRNLSCKSFKVIAASEKKSFDPNGTLYVSSIKEVFRRDEFCVTGFSNGSVSLKVCEIECGVTHNCLKKCCPPSKTFFPKTGQCNVSTASLWDDEIDRKFYKLAGRAGRGCLKNNSDLDLPLHITWGKPNKPAGHIHNLLSNPNHRLLSNGSLVTLDGKVGKVVPQPYCVEHGSDSQLATIILIKSEDSKNAASDLRLYFLVTLFVISIVFLVLTVFVYVLIWEKHNIHGWTVFAFVINLLAFFIILLASHTVNSNVTEEFLSTSSCHFLAYSHHFLYLATTCWMSVINADLWLTFRSLTPPTRSKMLMRFSIYVGFSTLLPLFILAIGIILTHSKHLFTYEDEDCGIKSVTISVPDYGRDRCTLHPDGELAYLYIPIGILLFANIVMFCSTVFNLWKYKETTKHAVSNSTSQACTQRQSLFLFLKLFFVMGISWVFELISRICSESEGEGDYWYLWVPADLLNFAQAVSVFFIFAAKRENILFIARKYPSTRHVLYRVLRWKLCRVDAVDIEQTEMTTTERGMTFKGRFSSFALTRKLSTVSTNSYENNRRKFSTTSVEDPTEAKHQQSSQDQTKV